MDALTHEELISADTASPVMRHALGLCRLYARVDRPVVLVGPVGAGKSTLAQEIHRLARLSGPFISVSSGELSQTLYSDTLFGHVSGAYTGAATARDGAIKQAAGGVLLLDDLALMPVVVQASILRVMESRRFRPLGGRKDEIATSRFIFATTVAPKELVSRGKLLIDLESRLGEFQVRVPALSERPEDILQIADGCGRGMLAELGIESRLQFSDAAKQLLLGYSWPANVRELKAVVERAVVHAGVSDGETVVRKVHLPERVRNFDPDSSERVELSSALVEWVLRETGGNKSEAARRLGVHRNTIARYLEAG